MAKGSCITTYFVICAREGGKEGEGQRLRSVMVARANGTRIAGVGGVSRRCEPDRRTHHVVPLLVHAEQQPELLVPFVDHDVDPLRELEGNDDDEMR